MDKKMRTLFASLCMICSLLLFLPVQAFASSVAGGPEELVSAPAGAAEAHIYYRTRIESYGWIPEVSDGAPSGTTGESKKLETIRVRVASSLSGDVEYRTHIQNIGWESSWRKNGAESGAPTGRSLRLEAIQMRLTGNLGKSYDIYYRVHIQRLGWSGWTKNGAMCGSAGFAYRLESIEIRLVPKGGSAPGSTESSYFNNTSSVAYSTQVQNVGWQTSVRDGAMAGTSNRSLRLETIVIQLENQAFSGGIEYRTHVQNKGWMSWVSGGSLSGSVGQGLRMEALQIRLTGTMSKRYDIYYCVHAQNVGWMGWAKNGQQAGTAGYAYRLEALRIKLVPKGNAAPGSTANYFKQKVTPTPTAKPTPTNTPTPTPTPKVQNNTVITAASFKSAKSAFSALNKGVTDKQQSAALSSMTGLLDKTDEYFPNGFKEGTPYTNANYYPWKGGYYRGGYGCAGFAFRLSDEAFQKVLATMTFPKDYTSVSQLKVGDILRLNYDTHSVIILRINESDNSVVVAEGNYNYSIHWGRVIPFSEFKKTGTNVLTRYQSAETLSSAAYKARVRAFEENYAKLPTLAGGAVSGEGPLYSWEDTSSFAEEMEGADDSSGEAESGGEDALAEEASGAGENPDGTESDQGDGSDTTEEPEEGDPENGTYTFHVQIIWEDENNYDEIRPYEVKLWLYSDTGSLTGSITLTGSMTADFWEGSLELPAADEEGNPIDYSGYRWKEEMIDKDGEAIDERSSEEETVYAPVGYTNLPKDEYELEDGRMTVIRNIHTPHREENVTMRRIRILWDDNENESGLRPASVTAELNAGRSVQLDEAGGWTGELRDLPVYYLDTFYEYEWLMPEIAGYEVSLAELDTVWDENDEISGEELILTYSPKPEEDDGKRTIWIQYYIRRGNQETESLQPVVLEYEEGETFYQKTPVIPGYTADRSEVTGVISSNLIVRVHYTPNTYTLTVRYRGSDGRELASPYIGRYTTGSAFRVPSPSIDGYRTRSTVISGTMPPYNRTFTVNYSVVRRSTDSEEEDQLLEDYPTPLGPGVGAASVNAGDCFE